MAQFKAFWDDSITGMKRRRGSDDGSSSGSDDSSSSGSGGDDGSSSSDDDIVIIDGVPVKVRGDGSIDDSQPGTLRIVGTRRDDDLYGTGLFKEFLKGRRGKDDFVLGNRRSSFYLKTRKSSRDKSFAIIEDLGRGDDLVLHGPRSEYRFGLASAGGETGLGIFHRGGKGTDLVALLADRSQIASSQLEFIG